MMVLVIVTGLEVVVEVDLIAGNEAFGGDLGKVVELPVGDVILETADGAVNGDPIAAVWLKLSDHRLITARAGFGQDVPVRPLDSVGSFLPGQGF